MVKRRMLLPSSVRNDAKMGSMKEEWDRVGSKNGCLNGLTRREVGRRTLPEKERLEKLWRWKRTESRTAVQMHKFSLIIHFLLPI
jgi:hypothetical protein